MSDLTLAEPPLPVKRSSAIAHFRNTIWVVGGAFFFGLAWYLIRTLTARYLSLREFGIFSTLCVFQITLTAVADFGLTYGFSRLIPPLRSMSSLSRKGAIIGIIIRTGALCELAVILFICAIEFSASPFLRHLLFVDESDASLVSLLPSCLWFVATCICVFSEAVASSFERFDLRALIMSSRMGWMLLGTILFVIVAELPFPASINAIFFWSSLPAVPLLLFGLLRVDFHDLLAPPTRSSIKVLLGTCWTTALVMILVMAISGIDLLVLSRFQPADKVGQYATVISCMQIVYSMVIALMQILLPRFSSISLGRSGQGEGRLSTLVLHPVYKQVERIIVACSVLSAISLYILADIALLILFGPKFLPMAPYLRVVALGIPFFSMSQLRLQALIAKGRAGLIRVRVIGSFLVYVGVVAFGVKLSGLPGAAYGNCAGYLLIFLVLSTSSLGELCHLMIQSLSILAFVLLPSMAFVSLAPHLPFGAGNPFVALILLLVLLIPAGMWFLQESLRTLRGR